MKDFNTKVLVAIGAWALVASTPLLAQGMGGGMMGDGLRNGNSGTMMGEGFGGGMMGNGWGFGNNSPQSLGMERLSMKDATARVQQYLASINNPNLVIGEVMEFDRNFYALIKEKDTGRGAFEVLVDPYSGAVGPEPGPNMMWNSKYGHRGWASSTSQSMTVSVEQARADAQKYLDGVGKGYTVEEHPDVFYGYYTAHVLKGTKVLGMLGINGYNGQVWFHAWHGVFRAMDTMDGMQ